MFGYPYMLHLNAVNPWIVRVTLATFTQATHFPQPSYRPMVYQKIHSSRMKIDFSGGEALSEGPRTTTEPMLPMLCSNTL